ncbi:MerR family transcriptional regulator [Paenibacillus sp. HN-1]|uniref:MerR family transcriptional regulator n=1 Tax=Paenibacillus TaxID=44249 RepID=UPI001CA9654E|nr:MULTISPECIES: MerR family transcriptional regulator [Paenibacillus]MBY9080924.1 MerR family transcriptional regulator [Paenibacillus sp. CGMCC 1.18879]MBY9085084.1 MerR family transcriptional regulator [Paenibacillus sinensis]
MTTYTRGELAKRSGLHAETLRYYEQQGLIPPPGRTATGYRLYTEDVLIRLAFIGNAKQCGFTIKEIRKALGKSQDQGIRLEDFTALIDRKMEALLREIELKEQTRQNLAGLKQLLTAEQIHPDIQTVKSILRM